jgi:hypothetical protein
MTLNECLRKALEDAHALVDRGYWIKIESFSSNVLLHWGSILSTGELECALMSKVYIAEVDTSIEKVQCVHSGKEWWGKGKCPFCSV